MEVGWWTGATGPGCWGCLCGKVCGCGWCPDRTDRSVWLEALKSAELFCSWLFPPSRCRSLQEGKKGNKEQVTLKSDSWTVTDVPWVKLNRRMLNSNNLTTVTSHVHLSRSLRKKVWYCHLQDLFGQIQPNYCSLPLYPWTYGTFPITKVRKNTWNFRSCWILDVKLVQTYSILQLSWGSCTSEETHTPQLKGFSWRNPPLLLL